MTYTEHLCVSVAKGKYTVLQEETGALHVLKHGKEWRDVTGDSLIFSLAAEIESLHCKIQDATKCLTCATIIDPMDVCLEAISILEEYTDA